MSSNRIKSDDIQIGNSYILPIEQSKVTVQQAKVRKILEETDAKAQQIIDGAENKSNVIVHTAQSEAIRIVEQARKDAQNAYESIKQQAYQEGFEQGQKDGLAKFESDAYEALKSLETLSSASFDMKKNIIDSATLDIVELVTVIADKVCHIEFDKYVLEKITLDAIKQLNDKENITIIVNPQLVENINSLSPKFKEEYSKIQTIKVLEDVSVSPDGVIVETLNTRLDSRISAQIFEISQKMLMGDTDELE